MTIQIVFNGTVEQHEWIHDRKNWGKNSNMSEWLRDAFDEKRKRGGWKPEKEEEEPLDNKGGGEEDE